MYRGALLYSGKQVVVVVVVVGQTVGSISSRTLAYDWLCFTVMLTTPLCLLLWHPQVGITVTKSMNRDINRVSGGVTCGE